MLDAAEQGYEADEAFGGTVTRQKCRLMPAPARSDAGTAWQFIPGVFYGQEPLGATHGL